MANKQNWTIWEMSFLVAMAVTNLQRSQPVDAAHARAAAFFRLGVTVACVGGLITVQVLKRRAATQAPPADAPASTPVVDPDVPVLSADQREIRVTYRSTREVTWRCNLYTLFHRRSIVLTCYLIALAFTLPVANGVYKHDPHRALIAFPFLYVLGYAAWMALFCLSIRRKILERLPSPHTVRICTSSLSVEGFRDETPNKVSLVDWGRVVDVRDHDGDIHVWWGLDKGCFIPRTAFSDLEESRRFHRAAVTLWKSKGTVWPGDFSVRTPIGAGPAPPVPSPPRPTPDENPYAPPGAILGDAPGTLTEGMGGFVGSCAVVFVLGSLMAALFWWLR